MEGDQDGAGAPPLWGEAVGAIQPGAAHRVFGPRLFTAGQGGKGRGNGHQLEQEKFRLHTRRNFFP